MLIAVMSAGCYESAFPLDPAPTAALDPTLLGTWRCIAPNGDDEAVSMRVSRVREGVDGVSMQERGKDPDRYEVYASVVGGNTVLNIRDMSATGSKPWVFGRSVLLRPDVLQIQIASDNSLKGVETSPEAVRRAIARRQSDPGLFQDGFTCVRTKDAR